MLLTATRRAARRSGFTLMEVLVVVAILVILAGVAIIAVPQQIDNARKNRAQLACQSLSQLGEQYKINPANTDGRYPQNAHELLQPHFGGPAMLKGSQDAVSPWPGREYIFTEKDKGDGTTYLLVYVTAPDGTDVSQYGIGPNAQPR